MSSDYVNVWDIIDNVSEIQKTSSLSNHLDHIMNLYYQRRMVLKIS